MGGVKRKASDVKVSKRLRLSEDVASSPVPSGDGSVSRSSPMANSEEPDIKPKMEPSVEYEVNTKVLCQHTDNNFYEAKIIKVDHDGLGNPRYTIHYNGWNARYDEVISHEEAITRFTEYNEENLEFAKRSLQNAKKSKKSTAKREDRSSKSGRRSVNSRTTGTLTPNLDQTVEAVIEQPIEETEPEPPIVAPIKTKALYPNIPEEINNLLVKDGENLTSNKLLKLPARKTLNDIFDEFLKAYQQKKARAKDVMEERIKMLKSCLNYNLQMRLLYKFELIQFLNQLNSLRKQSGLPEITSKEFFQKLNETDENTMESEDSDDDSEKPDDSIATHIRPSPSETKVEEPTRRLRPKKDTPKSNKKKASKTDLTKIDAKDFVPDFTTIYGPMIFFRFCSYAPTIFKQDLLSAGVNNYMVVVLNDVMEFICGKLDEYFDPNLDYENASSNYIRQINTFAV